MGLIATTGKRTKNPYHIAAIDRDVYSIEELMYSLIQSAQLLDEEILDPELVRWIREECGLKDLSETISRIIGGQSDGNDRVLRFVTAILDASDYATDRQREETKRILRTGEGMQRYEMREARADYMCDNGHFAKALAEYQKLLEELPEPERKIRTRIWHSCGVIYADMFRFDSAAECFQRASRLSGDSEYYTDYLAAVRMYLPDSDYIAFVGKHPEAYEASLELERRMKEADLEYEDAPGTKQIEHLRELKEQGEDESFRTELQATAREMRANYRVNVARRSGTRQCGTYYRFALSLLTLAW